MRTKLSSVFTILLGIVAILALLTWWIVVFWFGDVYSTMAGNEPNRAALVALYSDIDPGATRDDVLTRYYLHRTDALCLRADSPDSWTITMTPEVFETDWKLAIDFLDAKVVLVKFWTQHGPKPPNSPDDKSASNHAPQAIGAGAPQPGR